MNIQTISKKITSLFLVALLLITEPIVTNATVSTETDGGRQIENPVVQVHAGLGYSLAVREDGTVLYAGDSEWMRDVVATWADIDYITGYFARKKDGSYLSLDGPTNLPSMELPISICMASAGNWAALLPDGRLLYSPDPEHVDQFADVDYCGYGMPMEQVSQVVFGSDSYYCLLQSGKVIPFCMWDAEEEIAEWSDIKSLCFNAVGYYPIALTNDGRVLAPSSCESINTSNWTNVIKVVTNYSTTVGLRSDGTVLATGGEYGSESFINDVSAWTNIKDIAVSYYTKYDDNDEAFIAGLKDDGTVVLAGDLSRPSIMDLLNTITAWTDVIQLSVSNNHVLGLKADGTVVAAGDNSHGQCDLIINDTSSSSSFCEIKQLDGLVCALRKDGSVKVGKLQSNDTGSWDSDDLAFKECVEKWTNIKKIVVLGNMYGIAGIKEDGDVLVEVIADEYRDLESEYKECREWKEITDILSGYPGTFGLKKDGTVIATSSTIQYYERNYQRKFTYDTWKDIKEIYFSTNMNGDYVLLGLSGDGTLYYNGVTYFDHSWNGLINVAAVDLNAYLYLILRKDGTVDISGINCGEWTGDMYKWKEITRVLSGGSAVAGLKSDGTVLVAGTGFPEELNWSNISTIYFDVDDNLYGVCKDGTVKVCTRSDDYQYYAADRNRVETWNEIEKLSFLYDIGEKEMTIAGIKKDGSIVSTKNLFVQGS